MTDIPLAYDSDEEPPPESWGDGLLWRLDPAESFSDFTIEVSTASDDPAWTGGERIETYHVHRSTIALGPRGSAYFAHLLQGTFMEASAGVCRMSLDALAARAFPNLLDFVYGAPQLDCSTATATALHYLGDYFGMPRLRMQARQFWTTDLCLENAATYYRHAAIFHDDRIFQRIQDLVSERFMEIPLESEIFQVIDAPFLLRILQNTDFADAKDHFSRYASQLVAQVLENHRSEITEDADGDTTEQMEPFVSSELFLHLTDIDLLPEIDCCATIQLLRMERMLVQPHPDTLTSLQQRCLQSLATQWKYIRMTPSFMNDLRQHVSPVFLTELLAQSWTCAKEAVTMKQAEKNALHAENASLHATLQEKHDQNQSLRAENSRLRDEGKRLTVLYKAMSAQCEELHQQMSTLQSGPMHYSLHQDSENRCNSHSSIRAGKRAANGSADDPINPYIRA